MPGRIRPVLAIALAWLSVAGAHAQTARIDWFTTDAGGGASTSALYTVSSTLGQADAYVATAGQQQVVGGFWALESIMLHAPRLAIFLAPPNVTVTWPSPSTGFLLQEHTVVGMTNGWQNVSQTPADNGATKSVILPANAGGRYYRLTQP